MDSPILIDRQQRAGEAFSRLATPSFRHGQGVGITVDINEVLNEIQTGEELLQVETEGEIKVMKLSDCDHAFIHKFAEGLVQHDETKNIAAHYMRNPDAKVIIVPKDYRGSIKVNPIVNGDSGSPTCSVDSLILIVQKGAHVNVIQKVSSSTTRSEIIQVFAQAEADVKWYALHQGGQRLMTKRADIKNNASMTWLDILIDSPFTHLNVKTELNGEGSQAEHIQAFLGRDQQQVDINSDAIHNSPHTSSQMQMKGISKDYAKSVFRGTINVKKNAYGCSGHQTSKVLLTGENAKSDAIPVLEIENDDVVCSHASTIGQLDENLLYYAGSRGLDETLAKEIVMLGFMESILSNVPEEVRDSFMLVIEEAIK
jgi:Fe-S cluster assembly scaffold protein SufB